LEKKTGIEVVGVVGVIASLLFVGVQVQQSAANIGAHFSRASTNVD